MVSFKCHQKGFYEIRRIESENHIDSKDYVGLTLTRRLPSFIYMIISSKLATLKELRDDYDMWEAIDLYEICLVSSHNRYIMTKGDGLGGRKKR